MINAIFLLLSASVEPMADAPARPYYNCMLKQVAIHAKKTDKADEAIAAAGATCSKSRLDLEASIALQKIKEGASGRDAGDVAKIAMDKLDSEYRSRYIKAFLDARPSR